MYNMHSAAPLLYRMCHLIVLLLWPNVLLIRVTLTTLIHISFYKKNSDKPTFNCSAQNGKQTMLTISWWHEHSGAFQQGISLMG